MLLKFFNRFRSVYLLVGGLCLVLVLHGCGEDTKDVDVPDDTGNPDIDNVQTSGLQGDTYRSNEYLLKVSKLPIDSWTFQEVSNLASYDLIKTWKAAFDPGTKFNKNEDLFLLEPVAEADFVDTLIGAYEAAIPYIFVQIEEQTATDYLNPRQFAEGLLAQMTTVYPAESFLVGEKSEFLSRDRMPGYLYEIEWLEFEDEETGQSTINVGKAKEVFFMRSNSTDLIYHLSFWAPVDQYEEYLPAFDQIIEYIEFNAS